MFIVYAFYIIVFHFLLLYRIKIGGGVTIYCKNDIKVEQVQIKQTGTDIEIICVDMIFGSQKLRLITCYRPPFYTITDVAYLELMISIIYNLCYSVSQIIIVGDFNLPKMDWPSYVSPNEKCHSIFLNLVNELGLHQFVKEPTPNMNLLDLVFSNNSSLISDISVECPFSTSDHNTVQFSINTNNFNQCENKPEPFYDFSNADFKSLELYLSI